MDKALTGSNSAPTKGERIKIISQITELNSDEREKVINGEAWIGVKESILSKMWVNDPTKCQSKTTGNDSQKTCIYKIRVGDCKTGMTTKMYKVNFLMERAKETANLILILIILMLFKF